MNSHAIATKGASRLRRLGHSHHGFLLSDIQRTTFRDDRQIGKSGFNPAINESASLGGMGVPSLVGMNLESTIGELRFSSIDFESAGAARGQTDVPIQIGIACWTAAGRVTDHFVSYLKADRPVSWSARKVHGISDQAIEDAPRLQELWGAVRDRLGGAVAVAHGKGTEKRFLRAFPGHGFGPWVDTLLISRAAWPDLPSHSLSALCVARGLDQAVREEVAARNWHDALFDAVASLHLLQDVVTTFGLIERPLTCLLQPDLSAWPPVEAEVGVRTVFARFESVRSGLFRACQAFTSI